MIHMSRRTALIVSVVLLIVAMAAAQTRRHKTLSVEGYSGQANVVEVEGRTYVDVQDLARITHSSISFEENGIVFTPTHGRASETGPDDAAQEGFSPGFRKAAIQAVAAIREWGGMLAVTVHNGYPVENTMAGNTIAAHQARAAEAVALAATAASTETDRNALELLTNELNNVDAWSNRFVEARNELRTANMTMSENALQNDEEAQKAIRCAQFLAQTFASGTFQDNRACH